MNAIQHLLCALSCWRQPARNDRLRPAYHPTARRLAGAVHRGEVLPWYQPVVCRVSGAIIGAEVLARWRLPDGGWMQPDRFIPLAERTGLTLPLTRALMAQVAAGLLPVVGRLPAPFQIAFNIDGGQLGCQNFVADCLAFLARFPAGSVHLVLELTEREPLVLTPIVSARLAALRQHGISIALDDFGTGYANLGYLDVLPLDGMKIDKSFVGRIIPDAQGNGLVDSVIEIAARLGLTTVAEGVETAGQCAYLAAKGVDFLQGYYFAAPLPLAAFVRLAVLEKKTYPTTA